MKIQIAGEWLDMGEAEMSLHWANMRFSDEYLDAYSTDFELPMTATNVRLLDVWSVLSRSGDPFGSMVPCMVMADGLTSDGMLSVDGVTGQTIKATVYLSAIPADLAGVVSRLVVDNTDTIVDFTNRVSEETIGHVADVNYTLYQTEHNIVRPNIKLAYILDELTRATGVTMPTLAEDYRIIGTNQYVCPQNEVQLLYQRQGILLANYPTYGQHVANVAVPGEAYLRYNRHAVVELSIWAKTGSALQGYVGYVERRIGGGSWSVVGNVTLDGTIGNVAHTSVTLTVDSGHDIRVHTGNWTGDIYIVATHHAYTIGEEDYTIPLAWNSGATYTVPSWVAESETPSFVYYGMMCNIPQFTVRQLLSSLAWLTGTRIEVLNRVVSLIPADAAEAIDARIDTVDFMTDVIGRKMYIKSAGGEVLAETSVPSDNVADEVTLHESIFASLQGVSDWDIVDLDLYEENDGLWTPVAYDGGVALAVKTTHSSGRYYLMPAIGWGFYGLDALQRVCVIEAVTDRDISNDDFIYIDGHKYIIIDGDRDEATGLTTFRALLS